MPRAACSPSPSPPSSDSDSSSPPPRARIPHPLIEACSLEQTFEFCYHSTHKIVDEKNSRGRQPIAPPSSSSSSSSDELGRGGYGVVRRCRERATGEEFACKSIDKANAKDPEAFLEDIRVEVFCTGMLPYHPHVLRLRSFHEDANAFHLVLDLCEVGDLFEYVRNNGPFEERTARVLFREIASAVSFLHSHSVLHLDIKPENVLFTRNGRTTASVEGKVSMEEAGVSSDNSGVSAPLSAKLADFGQAMILPRGKKAVGVAGTSCYMSPEILGGKPFDWSADVWSLGMVLYVMLTGYIPYYGRSKEDVLRCIQSRRLHFDSPCWHGVSSSAKDLVRRMLCVEAEARPGMAQVMAHEWLSLSPHSPCPSLRASASFRRSNLSLPPLTAPDSSAASSSPSSATAAAINHPSHSPTSAHKGVSQSKKRKTNKPSIFSLTAAVISPRSKAALMPTSPSSPALESPDTVMGAGVDKEFSVPSTPSCVEEDRDPRKETEQTRPACASCRLGGVGRIEDAYFSHQQQRVNQVGSNDEHYRPVMSSAAPSISPDSTTSTCDTVRSSPFPARGAFVDFLFRCLVPEARA